MEREMASVGSSPIKSPAVDCWSSGPLAYPGVRLALFFRFSGYSSSLPESSGASALSRRVPVGYYNGKVGVRLVSSINFRGS
jgi:hypothetical protein